MKASGFINSEGFSWNTKTMAQENWQQVKDIFVDVAQQKPEVASSFSKGRAMATMTSALKSIRFYLQTTAPRALWNHPLSSGSPSHSMTVFLSLR